MSHWDFGRPAAGHPDTPPPYEPDWAAYRPGPGPESEEDLPYPLTYERDVSGATAPQPAVPPPADPWPPAPYSGGAQNTRVPACGEGGKPAEDLARRPARYGEPSRGGRFGTARPADTFSADAFPGEPFCADPFPGAAFPGGDYGRYRGRPRWLIPAGITAAAAAVGASVVLLAGGHSGQGGGHPGQGGGTRSAAPSMTASAPGGPGGAAPSRPATGGGAGTGAPLTLAQARAVLAGYTTANNSANAQRSGSRLAAIETGSSYAIDAALYTMQRAAGTAPYPPFGPVQATYYIPRGEPAAGPRWFVVRVANAFTASPKKVTSTEYLLFTQAAAGGAWRNAVEPYVLPGTAAPQVAVGPDGLATAVGPAAASVAVAPGRLPADTAVSLDAASAGQAAVADPGNLADRADQRFWQGKVPGGTVTDTHSVAAGSAGPEFALLTSDGGALVFYTGAAQLTITPPAGATLHLTVPGLYSPGQALGRAGLTYLEQFAAYDPPAAAPSNGGGTPGAPRIVADYSGITGGS